MTVFLSACVSNRAAADDQSLATYHNDTGSVMISDEAILFEAAGRSLKLTVCSKESDWCYYSGDKIISVPRDCPFSIVEYYNADKRFHLVGYVHEIITVMPKNSDAMMFSYNKYLGLTTIYWDYDGSGALRDRGDGLGVDRAAAQKYAFVLDKDQRAFPCIFSK